MLSLLSIFKFTLNATWWWFISKAKSLQSEKEKDTEKEIIQQVAEMLYDKMIKVFKYCEEWLIIIFALKWKLRR